MQKEVILRYEQVCCLCVFVFVCLYCCVSESMCGNVTATGAELLYQMSLCFSKVNFTDPVRSCSMLLMGLLQISNHVIASK